MKKGKYFRQPCRECIDEKKRDGRLLSAEQMASAERRAKSWQARNPERYKRLQWEARLRNVYGITWNEWDLMVIQHQGRCAICNSIGGKRGVGIDHDHVNKHVRGLLCNKCNSSVERLDNIPNWCAKATRYVNDMPFVTFVRAS